MSQGGATTGQGTSGSTQTQIPGFAPTTDQLAEINKVNGTVNNDPRWIGSPSGYCVPAMMEKMGQLQKAGIPLGSMMPVTVDAGPRYRNDAHSLLRITGEVDGKPWVRFLDINQPYLLTVQDLAELGYTILE